MGFVQMKIKIMMVPSNIKKDVEINKDSTVFDLLKKIKVKPDTVIVLKNNTPVPVDDILSDVKELRIIQVASGG
jgi:sulfur carrier protein ThiS